MILLSPPRAFFNFADLTPEIAATDREYLYGSFDRDICDKYLTIFADFEYFRQFWDGGLAPTPFVPDIWTDTGGHNGRGGVNTFGPHAFGISSAGFSVPNPERVQSVHGCGITLQMVGLIRPSPGSR